MPLRQSILSFYKNRSSLGAQATPEPVPSRPSLGRSISNGSSEDDPDTIVVSPAKHLPTPSESSLDVSTHGVEEAHAVSMKPVPKGRARRVSRRVHGSESQAGVIDSVDSESTKSRNVSGETLVDNVVYDNSSQLTLVKDGIKALDLPWDVNNVGHVKSAPEAVFDNDTVMVDPAPKTDDKEDEEEDVLRAQRAAAKKVKRDENNKKWEQKRKQAEKSATRRSSRVPILDRAAEVVASLANTVLGKRKHPSADVDQGNADVDAPASKKRASSYEPEPLLTTIHTTRRQKRWLASGLYAGQTRAHYQKFKDSHPKNVKSRLYLPDSESDNKVLPLPMYAGERLLALGRDFKLPFDMFSPLPPGQPKPDEWRKVNKSVFVGDAAQLWRTSKFEEHSACMCSPSTGCDADCMNRYMYYECTSQNCNLSPQECGNRAFDDLLQRTKKGGKYNIGVEVIKTKDRGYGVRANRSFNGNQIIVEYTGEILTQGECESRMRGVYKDNECYYLMAFDQNMIIDATRGSIARFVNHSCEPNCRMEKWTVNGKPRMALFAEEAGIMTGEELTYDYNFDPYSTKNVQVCRCGAPNCRGILGPKQKGKGGKDTTPEAEVAKAGPGGKLAGAKRKIAEIVDDATARFSKKAKLGTNKAVAKVSNQRTASGSGNKAKSASSSPLKVQKAKLIRKVISRKTSASHGVAGLVRRPSKLKRLAEMAKAGGSMAGKGQSKGRGKRVVSAASFSSRKQLLQTKPDPEMEPELDVDVSHDAGYAKDEAAKGVCRTSSIRARVGSVKSRVVRTMRGAASGQDRTLRVVGVEA